MSGALRLALLVAPCVATLLLAGCGQKGPLYLPDPAPQAVPATPANAPAPAAPDSERDRNKQGSTPAQLPG